MGSLKDEMKGLREDPQPCEKTDDGEHPGSSDGSAVPMEPQIYTSQELEIQKDCQPKLHMNVSTTEEEGSKNPISKDQALSGGDCDTGFVQVKETTPLTQQPKADKTPTATHNDISVSIKFLSGDEGDTEIQREISNDKSIGQNREKEIESISVPVPSTPGTSDPHSPNMRSPAPFGQHHMRTQVSLEVVQCRSAATSPMTPPEGGNSFFFPSSFGRSEGVSTDTKDAELQVGQQVEFCSVATSPMTPKTPSTTAFPVLIGRETVRKEEKVKKSEEQKESEQSESFPVTKSPPEAIGALKFTTPKEPAEGFDSNVSPESSTGCLAAGLTGSQVTVEDSNQLCKQQRMGSMDQDITILVTHYINNEEDKEEKSETSFYSIEPEMVKIDEYEEPSDNNQDLKWEDGKEKISTETPAPDQVQEASNINPSQNKTEDSAVPASQQPASIIKSDSPEDKENRDACEETKEVSKPHVPESPAPFGCHNIRTQVSLEVVQCQSAATSPMTPPDGEQAFYFPSHLGTCRAAGAETKDAELQVGQQVEFRSVATAPMTPRTPTITTFPEIRKGISEEKGEEPVQEVSWDEKGMTWEVYGAVVEVSVLGSAIQKHLEKQVKKQNIQPPTTSPQPLSSESNHRGLGSGKGQAGKRAERDGKVRRRRRNPFRLLMENMQQPHCCSRAHTTE
uniref:G protein-regulated inducer of neurite outgrowth C-terminal domain-containing protein n=1 Tax=Monopterus albus TaxID=43700 RepID=A0A3Q3Q7U6_MONAL